MNQDKTIENLIYLYALIPSSEIEDPFQSFLGIDKENQAYLIKNNDITSVVSKVAKEDFSQEVIDKNLQKPKWLEENGSYHHQLISFLNEKYTVIPMSLCTIFKDEGNLNTLIKELSHEINELFKTLQNKEEWNFKAYIDYDRFKSKINNNNSIINELKEQISLAPKGKQFFLKKKLEKVVNEETEKETNAVSNQFLDYFSSIVKGTNINKNWPKQLTGKQEDMILNAAFLIDKKELEGFKQKVKELNLLYENDGFIFETSGPWPPYHFAQIQKGE